MDIPLADYHVTVQIQGEVRTFDARSISLAQCEKDFRAVVLSVRSGRNQSEHPARCPLQDQELNALDAGGAGPLLHHCCLFSVSRKILITYTLGELAFLCAHYPFFKGVEKQWG